MIRPLSAPGKKATLGRTSTSETCYGVREAD